MFSFRVRGAYSANAEAILGGGYAMLEHHARLILRDVYSSWEEGDLFSTLSYFAPSAVFAVHATPQGASLIGAGTGRDDLGNRLEKFLTGFEVREFKLLHVVSKSFGTQSRAYFRYRHRNGSMEVDGTMRHLWKFTGDTIAHFELFHDWPCMRAFYAMAALETAH
jgi:hypothetical protein